MTYSRKDGANAREAVFEHFTDNHTLDQYTDWLEQNGQSTRADYIRMECRTHTAETRATAAQLLSEHRLEWLGSLSEKINPNNVHFERGFPVRYTLNAQELSDPDIRAEMNRLGPVQKLELTHITDESLGYLSEFPYLRSISCFDRTLEDAHLQHLAGVPQLEHLRLWNAGRITDAGLRHISTLTDLKELVVPDSGITTAGLAHLRSLSALETLDLSGANMEDLTANELAIFPHLKTLRLDEAHLTDDNVTGFRNLTTLETLSIGYNDITSNGFAEIAELTSLRALDVEFSNITDGIVRQLQPLKSLEHLNISHNTEITDGGLGSIASLKKLKTLCLNDTSIHGTGLWAIRQLPLEELDVSDTYLTDDGVREIGHVETLTSLSLGNDGAVTDHCFSSLKNLEQLRELHIGGTGITGQGLNDFLKRGRLPSLAEIYSDFPSAKQALQQRLDKQAKSV